MPYTQEQIAEAKRWAATYRNMKTEEYSTLNIDLESDQNMMIVLLATLEAEQRETKNAFDYLAFLGVPKERAHTVSNGIDVIVTRMQKEAQSLTHRATTAEAYAAKLEVIGDVMAKFAPTRSAWDAARKEKP